MPTLIRLVIVLLVLGGLAYGAMFALIAFVEPNDKEVTIRIPARDLMQSQERDPLVLREIDTGRSADPPPPEEAAPTDDAAPADAAPDDAAPGEAAPATEATPVEPSEPADEEGSIVTLSPGNE